MPAKMSDCARPILFVKINDRFRIARGSVSVASLFERASMVAVVVDFAVVDDPDGIVFVSHRLVSAAKINYREAAMRKPDALVNKDARIIRPAMRKRIAHRKKHRAVNRSVRVFRNGDAADSTH